MADLYSQYTSGTQFTAGTMTGSALGVSGLNPLVDRINFIMPDAFPYVFIDDSPSFVGTTYTSKSINLNQNFSGCRIKGSYFASGTGSVTWELYKLGGSGAITSTILGSFTTPAADFRGLAYDTTNQNLLSVDYNNYVYQHDGVTSTLVGSFSTGHNFTEAVAFYGGNIVTSRHEAFAVNQIYFHTGLTSTIIGSFMYPGSKPLSMAAGGDFLYIGDAYQNFIYKFSGISATLLGSFVGPATSLYGLAYDGKNFISCDRDTDYIYIHSGISSTFIGSFATPKSDPHGLAWASTRLVSADDGANQIYEHGGETLVSGLPYNDLFTVEPHIDIGSFPQMRIKVQKSQGVDRVNTVVLDYK